MRVESFGHGVIADEALTREQIADEFLLMGLRLAEGIDLTVDYYLNEPKERL